MAKKDKRETELDAAFKKHFDRVQIPVLHLGRIFEVARKLMDKNSNMTADQAMAKLREDYT